MDSTSTRLVQLRIDVIDETEFIARCLEGAYQAQVADTADEVHRRKPSGMTVRSDQEVATAIIEAIIAAPDRVTYGNFRVIRLVRGAQSLDDLPIADRIDVTVNDYWSTAEPAWALRFRRYRNEVSAWRRALFALRIMRRALRDPHLYLWQRAESLTETVYDALIIEQNTLRRPEPRT
jgi:hypothetical protein